MYVRLPPASRDSNPVYQAPGPYRKERQLLHPTLLYFSPGRLEGTSGARLVVHVAVERTDDVWLPSASRVCVTK